MAQTSTIPMTLLEAVNIMLEAVGQAQVMSLESVNMNEETQLALTVISNTSREVQQRGWHCNEEEDFPLIPDANGNIFLPDNVAQWTLAPRSYSMDVTQRGTQLYNRALHSFNFQDPATGVAPTIYANMVVYLEFMQLPPPLRWYITARAARVFAVGRDPDTATFKLTNEVENDAWAQALAFDSDARGTTLVDTNFHFAYMRRRRV